MNHPLNSNVHRHRTVLTSGVPIDYAKAAMIMIHGRGASPEDILSLVPHLAMPDFYYIAPKAAGNTWYPYSFLSPIDQNEPGISTGLAVIADLITQIEAGGIPAERIMLLGFSQGACLSLEFAARNARRYGGVAGLSGGLIGPDGTSRRYPGSLEGTPVFLGCSDVDMHIPKERVNETADVLELLGGQVTERLYPSMGHMINQDELDVVRNMMQGVLDLAKQKAEAK